MAMARTRPAGTTTAPICASRTPRAASRPRAVPGVPGHIFVGATDEHDEDGTLISDEFTNPHKRRMMVEKRGRKMQAAINEVAPPKLVGPENAAVTLVGWGSTYGVIREAVEKLAGEEGIVANHLHIKWIVPFHAAEIGRILSGSKTRHHRREQLQWPVRPLPPERDRVRSPRPHPQVRRRTVHAPSHRRSSQRTTAGKTRLSVPVHEVLA